MKRAKACKLFHVDQCFYVILIFIILNIIWVASYHTQPDKGFNTDKSSIYPASWDITWDEEQMSTTLPAVISNPKGSSITMRTILQQADVFYNSILFYSRQSHVVVTLDDAVLWDSGEVVAAPYPVTYGSYWNCIRLPENWEGKELCITLYPQFSEAAIANQLQPVYIGTKSAFIYQIVRSGLFKIIFCLLLFTVGVLFILNSIFYIHRDKAKQLFFLGSFAACISIWMLLESRVIQLVTGNLTATSLILSISFELIPVLAVRFFLTYDTIAKKRYMRFIYGVGVLLLIIIRIISVAGIQYEFKLQSLIQIYAILALGGLLFYLATERKRIEKAHEKTLYYGILILLISSLLEFIYFFFIHKGNSGYFIQVGVLVFICYLGLSIIKEGKRLRADDLEKQLLEEMAYTDGLTRMSNRLAFEKEMDRLRSQTDGKSTILIADINNLKLINDQYGHTSGDDAIKQIGALLEQVFTAPAKCYRIGGDEFCVIENETEQKSLEEKLQRLQKLVAETRSEYTLRISIGMHTDATENIDEIFRQADQQMYACKKRMKEMGSK